MVHGVGLRRGSRIIGAIGPEVDGARVDGRRVDEGSGCAGSRKSRREGPAAAFELRVDPCAGGRGNASRRLADQF
jgi:hypothetical protein